MSYRRRASPLHAARAAAGCAYCLALAIAVLMLSNPIALGALTLAIAAAGACARVWRELRRAAVFGLMVGRLSGWRRRATTRGA